MKLRNIVPIFLALIFIVFSAFPAFAEEEITTANVEAEESKQAVKEIYDYSDLLEISKDPSGSYKLMADIDLKDILWEPINFHGSLDGNGYSIVNITVNQTSSQTRKTYDGNLIDYDTTFSGFFGILENANITDLDLLGLKVSVDTDSECFVGGIAGFMENSKIRNCSVTGEATLYTSGKCFGIGGFAGFGNGQIEGSKSDMTLVCVDKDSANPDEQFMGGAYAGGYIDLDKNEVKINGFVSDHGYVHNGGLLGIYVLYPQDDGYQGYVTNNRVSGKISFFEDNADRRAYCEPIAGEIMNWTFNMDGNEDDFEADEHFEYDYDLLPHDCAAPDYSDTVKASSCSEKGYTEHYCNNCGYTYVSDYTLPVHEVEKWTVTREPTAEEAGLQQGSCTKCGTVVYERIDKVQSEVPETETAKVASEGGKGGVGTIILIIIIVIVVVLIVLYLLARARAAKAKKMRARQRAQRRAEMERAGRRPQSGQRPQGRRPQTTNTGRRPQRPSDRNYR